MGGIDISPVIVILIIIFIQCGRAPEPAETVPVTPDRADRPIAVAPDGIILAVRLTPKGGRDAIDGIETLSDGRAVLKARVRAAPFEGEANAALGRVLGKGARRPTRPRRDRGRGHVPHQAREDRPAMPQRSPPRWRRSRARDRRCAASSKDSHDGTHHRRQGDRRRAAREGRRAKCSGCAPSTDCSRASRSCWSARIRRARSTCARRESRPSKPG